MHWLCRIQTVLLRSLNHSPDCSPEDLPDNRQKLKSCWRWRMLKPCWAAGSYCTLSEEQICFCHNDRVQHCEHLWGEAGCRNVCTIILLIYMIHGVETKSQIHRRQIKVAVVGWGAWQQIPHPAFHRWSSEHHGLFLVCINCVLISLTCLSLVFGLSLLPVKLCLSVFDDSGTAGSDVSLLGLMALCSTFFRQSENYGNVSHIKMWFLSMHWDFQLCMWEHTVDADGKWKCVSCWTERPSQNIMWCRIEVKRETKKTCLTYEGK